MAPQSAESALDANGTPSRRDRPWLLPYNRKLRNLTSISLRNLSLSSSSPTRQRGKTIDDDALPHTLVSPAKLVALREQKTLGHSRSSSDLRRVPEHALDVTDSDSEVSARANGSPGKGKGKDKGKGKENGTPKTPQRPAMARMRRRSTLEWANASPQRRQEKLEGVTAERMADVFFSLHVAGIDDPIYVSETVERTMNPTFHSLDLSSNSPGTTRLDSLTLRFWAKSTRWQEWRQLLELSLHMRELQYLGKHLEGLQRPLPHNAVLFHMLDGVYTTFSSLSEYTPLPQLAPPKRTQSSRSLPTSSFDALLRLAKLDDSIQDALATRHRLAGDLEALLETNKHTLKEHDQVAEAHDRLKTIEYAKKTVAKQLEKGRKQQEEKRASLQKRRDLMSADIASRSSQTNTIKDGKSTLLPKLLSDRDTCRKSTQAQRRRICEDLQTAYPIQPLPNKPLAFKIRDLPLPNSDDLDSTPPEGIAAALGHITSILQLLGFYLSTPLPYPVHPRGSTSTIHDPISLLKGTGDEKILRTYPLFTRGVPRFRFEYAVFLLNKDIQALLEDCFSVRVLDIRHTLPNLKYLLYVATAGEGELPARKAGGVRGLAAREPLERKGSQDSVGSAFSGVLWHGNHNGKGKGAVESLRRNVGGRVK